MVVNHLLTKGGVTNIDVSKNGGTPKSSSLIGFSIINHPFWGTPMFGNPHIDVGDVDKMMLI